MNEDYDAFVDEEAETLRQEAEWHAMFGGEQVPEEDLVFTLIW